MRFDYIIIGSGSSGGVLTARLTENENTSVLVLEAGQKEGHWTIRMPAATRNNFLGGPRNWCFETEPEPYMDGRRIFQPRGKVVGGSSSINGMVFVRGNRQDFDNWEAAGATGWGYDDVLPHFRNMETYIPGADDYRGGDGPIEVSRHDNHHPIEDAFLEAAQQAGHNLVPDYNGAHQEGITAFDANINRGERSGTAKLIGKIRSRQNLTIETGAHVTRILIESGRAIGVEYVRNGTTHQAFCDQEVILSAGAAQSPQILMLSGIGPAAHLREMGIDVIQDLPGVGQNLHDHLEIHIKFRCDKGKSKNKLLKPHNMLRIGAEWFLFRSGPGATTPSRVGGFLRSNDQVDYPNIQYHFWPYYHEDWTLPPNKDGFSCSVGPMSTDSRGWVKLASADPFAAPRMLLNGLSTEKDRREFRECVNITREIMNQAAFAPFNGYEVSPGPEVTSTEDIDAYVRATANSAYHLCGTCRMGSDEMAVIDPQLRVHGIDGLRVADASIMPSITNGNLNAPSLMIGEKASTLIRGNA